eukprot:4214859-Prymnesium_polylepis.1
MGRTNAIQQCAADCWHNNLGSATHLTRDGTVVKGACARIESVLAHSQRYADGLASGILGLPQRLGESQSGGVHWLVRWRR